MVDEVLSLLEVAEGAELLDCTLGGGGHSGALLAAGGTVTALDRDAAAITAARERLKSFEATGRFRAIQGSFADTPTISELQARRFDGILADLGVSSHQIDDDARGFSFRPAAPLDMRMDAGSGMSAAMVLGTMEEEELARIFRDYGDEPRARRLAREVVRRRHGMGGAFATSDNFVDAIRGALGPKTGPGDFARLFQAIRIAVNDEIGALERALPLLRERLKPGGVLAVISYHSGEDRLVKHSMREWSRVCICPPRQMHCTCRSRALGELLTRKSVRAGADETARNPRARSAHLRAWRSAL